MSRSLQTSSWSLSRVTSWRSSASRRIRRLTRVHRWPRGMPQYVLGHPERLGSHRRSARQNIRGSRSPAPRTAEWGSPTASAPGEAAAESVVRALDRRSRVSRDDLGAPLRRGARAPPGGVSSPVRAFRAVGGAPLFVERGEGAYLVDVDGNRYLDYVLSWGPLDPRARASARRRSARRGAARRGRASARRARSSSSSRGSIRDAMPSIELVRFVSSGTEATMSALRARARVHGAAEDRQVRGCYHGHADLLLVQAGSGVATLGLPDSPGVTPGAVARHARRAVQRPRRGRAALRRARRHRRGDRRAGRRQHGARPPASRAFSQGSASSRRRTARCSSSTR